MSSPPVPALTCTSQVPSGLTAMKVEPMPTMLGCVTRMRGTLCGPR